MENMKTRIEKIDRNKLNKKILCEAGDILKKGGLVAFPTETVYGLGQMRWMKRQPERPMPQREDRLIIR